jgi:cell wall-associated NlpC family hydrolase
VRNDAPMRSRVTTVFVAAVIASGCSSSASRRFAGVPSGVLEESADPERARVLDFAGSQVGKRYCWGGTGPACFDCSGLVQSAWASVGVRVPRTADAIASELPEVPLDNVRAGDILWWPGHVGLYAGNGWVVEALDRRHGVVRRPAAHPHRAFRPSG